MLCRCFLIFLLAAYNERERIEEELRRKDELSVNLMNDIEILKEEKSEIQTRTTETMSSLLRDLTDMGVAVNPDVGYDHSVKVKVQNSTGVPSSVYIPKVVSVFDSHWKERLTHFIPHLPRYGFPYQGA